MRTLSIQSTIGNSEILVGETLTNVSKYLPSNKKIAIITDKTIHSIYGNQFPKSDIIIEIPEGENNKVLHTLEFIFEKMVAAEFDRTSFILGIGGGIVCDVSGFAASTFMRGIDFGFVSTTLLSQVDASVGGKNGVNFQGFKNMIGTFCLPKFVICELQMLKSLPLSELLSGMAEVVKHGAIADSQLLDFIEKYPEKVLEYNAEALERFVYDSVVIKSSIVNKDAKEGGARRLFNFGHTFGHAIEKNTKMPHGYAVSIGMVIAAKISNARGLLSNSETERLTKCLSTLGLPTSCEIEPKSLFEALKRDKKREGDGIHFVLLKSLGEACVEKLSLTELEQIIHDLH